MSTDVTTDRPMRADAARNRDRVLAAASELFAEVGLRAGIEDIARRAGVGVGTVCRNFPAKEALVEAVVSALWRSLLDAAVAALAAPDPGPAFEQFVYVIAEFQAKHRALAEEMAAEINLPIRDQVRQDLHAAISQLVARAQAVGTLRTDIGPADVAMLLSGVAHAATLAGDVDPGLRDRFVRIVLDGLRPLDPTPLPGRALDFAGLEASRSRGRR